MCICMRVFVLCTCCMTSIIISSENSRKMFYVHVLSGLRDVKSKADIELYIFDIFLLCEIASVFSSGILLHISTSITMECSSGILLPYNLLPPSMFCTPHDAPLDLFHSLHGTPRAVQPTLFVMNFIWMELVNLCESLAATFSRDDIFMRLLKC